MVHDLPPDLDVIPAGQLGQVPNIDTILRFAQVQIDHIGQRDFSRFTRLPSCQKIEILPQRFFSRAAEVVQLAVDFLAPRSVSFRSERKVRGGFWCFSSLFFR